MYHPVTRHFTLLTLILAGFTICCSAQTEEQALQSLRQMTADGRLPSESAVAEIEKRFASKKTGALARLLRARIKLENGDAAGAAALLDSDIFAKRTMLGDYALWLRGKALKTAGDNAGAMRALEQLVREYPGSIRVRDARLLWADAAMSAGRAVDVPPFLIELSQANDADGLLLTAKAYDVQGSQQEAVRYFRRTLFFAAGTPASKESAAKLTTLQQPLTPVGADEQIARADSLLNAKNFGEAANAYNMAAASFPSSITPAVQLKRVTALAGAVRMADAQSAFAAIPASSPEREQAYRQMVLGYAKARMWPQARAAAEEMRSKFLSSALVPKTFVDAGLSARDARNREFEGYFLTTAVSAFPNSVDVASAQFEAAWFQHEQNNFALSAQMMIDHLARYADKDTSSRGKAGYWAARDSERAGNLSAACSLYQGVLYRYAANWYGYLAKQRVDNMIAQGTCGPAGRRDIEPVVAQAVANLKKVTVAAETAGPRELERIAKSDDLSTIGLFDWAIDELTEARKTAAASPKVNLALARHHRWKGNNTAALVAMQKSYPDYAQMFPEEMGQEEWSFFYPLSHWDEIKKWSAARGLDRYNVAGFIRQETVFDPKARSSANAFGLMQLLLPTAKTTARKYGASATPTSGEDLFDPSLNIELGTAYMKDQFAKFGRVEFVAVAYNAGPGRVPQWRATLPAEIDEFVEEIPFKETKQYVQGIIRNTAQYRRLYDDNGNFRPNVGTKPLRGEIDSVGQDQATAMNPDLVIESGGE